MATFYNQATLSYNGTVTSSNITTGEILEVLAASKNSVTGSYTSDSEEVFVISLVNNGASCLENITVTDDLGAYQFGPEGTEMTVVPMTYTEGSMSCYVNGILQAAPVVSSLSPLTVTGINVPAGGNTALIYAARTNQFAPLGENASIVNTAVMSGTGFSDVSAAATLVPAEGADLAISKSLSPTAVEENGQVTYTFIIQNFGSTAADVSDNVIFNDIFDPALSNLRAEFNGAVWAAGTNYTYEETTGAFTTLEGQITVPAAQFTQDASTGAWSVQPGVSTLIITGNI